jgi:hypothetical protein
MESEFAHFFRFDGARIYARVVLFIPVPYRGLRGKLLVVWRVVYGCTRWDWDLA